MRASKGSFSLKAEIPCTIVKGLPFHFGSTFSAKYIGKSKNEKTNGPVFRCTLRTLEVANDYFLTHLDSIPFGSVLHPFFIGSPEGDEVKHSGSITHPFAIDIVIPVFKFQKIKNYSNSNSAHRQFAKAILESNLAKNKEVQERLLDIFKKSIKRADKKTISIIEKLRYEKTNEEIRKCQQRENNGYHQSTAIMQSLFFNNELSESASKIYVSQNSKPFKLVFPPDRIYNTYGYRTKVITFGLTPYPFAVAMVYESEPFGAGDALTHKEQLFVVAEVGGQFIIVPIDVSHAAPEEQLEIAALMAVSSELEKEKLPCQSKQPQ
jgi:hypothetical protein